MSATTLSQIGREHLMEARASADPQKLLEVYDVWASTYNDEVNAYDYVGPVLVAQAALQPYKNPSEISILDAGCGTGLVGQALVLGGVKIVDGLDFSPAMLKIAGQSGVYRRLVQGDLTRQVDIADNTYEVVTCCGTFTSGHVGPDPGLRELVRITKRRGTVVATVLEEIWVSGGFKAEVEKLKAEKLVKVVSQDAIDYVRGHGNKAILVVLEKTDLAKATP